MSKKEINSKINPENRFLYLLLLIPEPQTLKPTNISSFVTVEQLQLITAVNFWKTSVQHKIS